MSSSLTFLRISESNIEELSEGISELHLAMYGSRYGRDYWRWCYLENPAGKNSSVVALRGERVVGKIGNIYLEMTSHGERITAGQMEGLFIRPDERSWACYAGLMEKSHAGQSEDHVAFSFGLSNPASAKLSRRTGGTSLGRAPVYTGFISTVRALEGRILPYPLSLAGWLLDPILGPRLRGVNAADLIVRPISEFDASFDELWNAIEASRALSIVKNAEYLNWRYVRCPGRRYTLLAAYRAARLDGLAVYRPAEAHNDGLVLELLARDDDTDTMKALLLRIFQRAKGQRVGILASSFPQDSPAANAVKELGCWALGKWLWNMEIVASPVAERKSRTQPDLKRLSYSLGDWLYY
jgi:hypothetical protein